MFRFYWKSIWWLFRVGVLLWFLLMPVLPIYGWLVFSEDRYVDLQAEKPEPSLCSEPGDNVLLQFRWAKTPVC